jgi:hypothetical protein
MRRGTWGCSAVLAFAVTASWVVAAQPVSALGIGIGVSVGVGVDVGGPAQRCGDLSGSATLSPGLSDTPTNVTITANGTLTRCASSKTGDDGSFSATINIASATCSGWEGSTLTATGATTWRNKKVSNYALTFRIGSGDDALVATITGKVTSGLFSGRRVSGRVKFGQVGSPNCATIPVTNLTFTNTRPFIIS